MKLLDVLEKFLLAIFLIRRACAFDTREEKRLLAEAISRIPCSVKIRSKHIWTTGLNRRLLKVRSQGMFQFCVL